MATKSADVAMAGPVFVVEPCSAGLGKLMASLTVERWGCVVAGWIIFAPAATASDLALGAGCVAWAEICGVAGKVAATRTFTPVGSWFFGSSFLSAGLVAGVS